MMGVAHPSHVCSELQKTQTDKQKLPDIQTDTQTNGQTAIRRDRQTDRQTGKRTSKRQEDRHIHTQTNVHKHTHTHTDRLAEEDRLTDTQTKKNCRQAGTTSRQTD